MGYALISHTEPNATAGGPLTAAGADNVFADGKINAVDSNADAVVVSLSGVTFQFALALGIYRIRAVITFCCTNAMDLLSGRAVLYNVTRATIQNNISAVGSPNVNGGLPITSTSLVLADNASTQNGTAMIIGRFAVLNATEVYSIRLAGVTSASGAGTDWFSNAFAQGAISAVTAGSINNKFKDIEILKE